MKTSKTAGINFILLLVALISTLGNAVASPLNADSLASRLMFQVWSFPQEKVYVMTDRDAYTSGDTIRLRSFLIDAATHTKPKMESRFIYVELINPFGKVANRIKIRSNKDIFAGIIPLDEELAEGNYTLCAYTLFMANSGKEYFFRKTIPIFSHLSKKYKLSIDINGGILTARLLERVSDNHVRAEYISISGPDNEFYAQNIRKRSSFSIKINEKMTNAGIVKVNFDRYEKFVTIPTEKNAISITFHPEGGHLIPGIKNRLAFKAIDRKGLSVDFKGVITDETGKKIIDISPTHRGMGVISFVPETGHTYKALVDDMSFTLPESSGDASILTVNTLDSDSIVVKVNGKYSPDMSLIAHNGGIVSLARNMDNNEIRLQRSSLGSGIVQLLLADRTGNTLSSRMIFNHSGYIYTDSIDSIPSGDYALRAFRNIKSEPTASIVSNLLLQSELKGHIEDPDYYFRNRDSITDAHLELLLLTNGWERYDIQKSLKGSYATPDIPIELGGEITGIVKSRWRGKPLQDAIVMLMAPKLEYATQTFTDKDGRFVFDGFDWPQDTSFIIQVFGKEGNKEHNYNVDNDVFPKNNAIPTSFGHVAPGNIIDESILTSGTIMLEELEVTAPMTLEESRRQMMEALGVRSFSSEDIEEMHATTYEEVLRKIPGIRIVNGNVVSMISRSAYNRGYGGIPVEFWVDGSQWISSTAYNSGTLSMSPATAPNAIGADMQTEHSLHSSIYNTLFEFAGMYPLHIMKSIEYYRSSVAMIISASAAMNAGALVFTTKDGSDIKEWDTYLFIRDFKPLGYQDEPDSYNPHYIYDPTSDDAIFNAAWLPDVEDVNKITLQPDTFYQIEGITDGCMPVLIHNATQPNI